MRRPIQYHTSTNIWLSLEDYHNAGLTSEQTKQVIESIRNPFSNFNLRCNPSFLNGNWNVDIITRRQENIQYVVDLIEVNLDRALNELQQKKKKKKVKK